MDNHYQRALALIEAERFDSAAQELRLQLTQTPDDAPAFAMLALCLVNLKKHPEAIDTASKAIHADPTYSFAHYMLGHIYFEQENYKKAESAADSAIALDPENTHYFALLGRIHYGRGLWRTALSDANSGLAINPEHNGCANVRATALVMLGRDSEARATLDLALSRDPENGASHSNRGWALLYGRRYLEAMQAFREALRLDPNEPAAKKGMIEALKARNLLYGITLRYAFWMGKFSSGAKFIVIFGVIVCLIIGLIASASSPALMPLDFGIIILYALSIYLSWTLEPLSNLLLRLDNYGRYVLSRKQIIGTNWFGGSLLIAFSNVIGFLVTHKPFFLCPAIGFFLLTMPIALTFSEGSRKRTIILGVITGIMGVLAVAGTIAGIVGSPNLAMELWAVFGVIMFYFILAGGFAKA